MSNFILYFGFASGLGLGISTIFYLDIPLDIVLMYSR